ncbi:class I SAM-dependent methyltransferase [Embleya sp. NPDC050493]|uniref:class I SAM-dependent methyltransferase n=1 Tax=Embleya sp. NPDC050493 TaxID=3363989 RepID=UPI0037AB5840
MTTHSHPHGPDREQTREQHRHPHHHQQQHDRHGGVGAPHGDVHRPHDESGWADMLDLDAEVFGSLLDELTDWVRRHGPQAPRRIADVGAGTGTGSLALARRFEAAEIVAIDNSTVLLDRLRAAAAAAGLTADRLHVVQADLEVAWPSIDAVDVAWAASSLHHFADPDHVLRDIHAALNPDGLLVVVEMDALPRFLPDDLGIGRPGLEARCHEAAARAGGNAYPDWRPYLERAGFAMVGQHTFTIEASPAPPVAVRYAYALLSRFRAAFGERLAADDLDTLDRLLANDGPDALVDRRDLTMRSGRTAWAARRP